MAFSFAPLPLSNPEEILHDLSPFILIHKNGKIERLLGDDVVPPSIDPITGTHSKDVIIAPETGLSVRIYVPGSMTSEKQKLAVLVYFHGGGFVAGTASSAIFQPFHNKLALQANIMIVSVDYRNAPEHPYPAPFDDAWTALQWVVSHAEGNGDEPWINEYADFKRLFIGGESAGANISHQIAMRIGLEKVKFKDGVVFGGIILIHPYFWGETLMGGEVDADVKERNVMEKLWRFANPFTSGLDDPIINPGSDVNIGKLGCKRVLVCVAEKDLLRDRGWYYYQVLDKSEWGGVINIIEAKGEGHAFHLFPPFGENAITLIKTMSMFINNGDI
ncbi:probable carboxylesterase 12 [Rutidosis leptorrhynchoides]|uniref:probable carboxylesterase 12 n=1 Tax=Rutidosis leptorrhynchoides TaxID=125765 RepID=UPI003A992D95